MITPSDIAAMYDRKESEAGGLAKAEPRQILREIAAETGLNFSEVQRAMIDAWTGAGAG